MAASEGVAVRVDEIGVDGGVMAEHRDAVRRFAPDVQLRVTAVATLEGCKEDGFAHASSLTVYRFLGAEFPPEGYETAMGYHCKSTHGKERTSKRILIRTRPRCKTAQGDIERTTSVVNESLLLWVLRMQREDHGLHEAVVRFSAQKIHTSRI